MCECVVGVCDSWVWVFLGGGVFCECVFREFAYGEYACFVSVCFSMLCFFASVCACAYLAGLVLCVCIAATNRGVTGGDKGAGIDAVVSSTCVVSGGWVVALSLTRAMGVGRTAESDGIR